MGAIRHARRGGIISARLYCYRMAITNGPAENNTTATPWSTGAASWNCKQTPGKEASVCKITWVLTAIWEMTVSVLTN